MCARQDVKSYIKVLQTLGLSFVPANYRHVGPKGPEEMCFYLTAPGRPAAAPALPCNRTFSSGSSGSSCKS